MRYISVAAVKISVVSFVESLVSRYENHFPKERCGTEEIHGFYVALAIIFGIPGPRYFLPCVVQKILDLAFDDQPKMEDIPDM